MTGRAVAMWFSCNAEECTQCTGAMINRNYYRETRFLLTASHCGATDDNADSIIAVFNYETAECGGPMPDYHTLPQVRAVAVLFSDPANGVALLGLRDTDSFYVGGVDISPTGWLTPAFSTDPGFCLYHPLASFMRAATLEKDGTIDSQPAGRRGAPCASSDNFRVTFVDDGRLEPGADGAPIFERDTDEFRDSRIKAVVSCYSDAYCDFTQPGSGGRLDHVEPLLRPYLSPADPVFVNSGWSGYERGTAAEPMRYISNGAFSALRSSTLHIFPGTYNEHLFLDRQMILIREGSGGSVVIGR